MKLLRARNFSLRTKLIAAFALVAIVCILMISFLANFLIEKQFRNYVIQKQEKQNEEVVSSIKDQFINQKGWNSNVIETIGMNALSEGMIIKIQSAKNELIWDAAKHNKGLCRKLIDHLAHNMMSRYPSWDGQYMEKPYKILINGNNEGTVIIGYYGPFYFNDIELNFITALNKALFPVAAIAIIFAFFVAVLISKRISSPINKVAAASREIAQGNYGIQSNQQSTTKEIKDLISTINNLSNNLLTQETLRKRLTGDVAHELRTPAATLQSHLEALMDGIWEPTYDRLKSCHDETIRINKMIGDISKLAKYESESMILDKTKFNIKELLSSTVLNFESEFINKNIELELICDDIDIYTDKYKLSQVLNNLLSNALKYTAGGGKVSISTDDYKDYICISVKDNGQGIPQEDLPFIFERFYRADKSRNRMTGGSGIGLAIVKAIIDAHKGKIEVKSVLNQGSTFTVYLPKK